jgi:hypothetical protein
MATAFLDRVSNKAIGQLLLEKGVVTDEQLVEALAAGQRDGIRVGEALVRLGYVSRETLSYVLGEQYGVRPMELHPSMLDERLIRRFPLELLQQHQLLPLIELGNELVVVMSDPNDTAGLRELSSLAPQYTVLPQLADAQQLRRCLETLKDRLPRSSGHTTPLQMPTECRLDPVVPAPTEVTFANWLVTTAVQDAQHDLVLRQLADCCLVSRQGEGAGLTEIHRFPADSFSSARDALLRNCVTIDHTGERGAAWNAPLKFGGSTYDLFVLTAGNPGSPLLRLRALQHAGAPGHKPARQLLALEPATCTFVFYDELQELEEYLAVLVLQTAGSQITLLLQDVTRRTFEGVYNYPAPVTDSLMAARDIGATCVIFDSPPAQREVLRLLAGGDNAPAVVVCAPNASAGISPDVEELRRRVKSETIQLGASLPKPRDNDANQVDGGVH